MDGATYQGALAAAPRVAEHFARHIEAARATAVGSVAFAPDEKSLEAIIDAAFWASLRREEGYAPKISLAFLPPEQAVRPLMFEKPLALGAAALARVAPAVERAGIHLGVWPRDGQLSVWGTTRVIPAYCFVLEVASPGLLVIKHHRGDISGKFVNVAVLEGDRLKIVDEGTSSLPDCPPLLTSLRRLRAAGFVGRVGERARPAGGVDARARPRRGAAGGAGGQRHVARIDRPADFVQHRAAGSTSSPT